MDDGDPDNAPTRITLAIGQWLWLDTHPGANLRLDIDGEAGWWRVVAADALTLTLVPYMPTWRERLSAWWLDHVRWSWPARRARRVYHVIEDALWGMWTGA